VASSPSIALRPFHRIEATFEVILDGFHVVDRLTLQLGQLGDVDRIEVIHDSQQAGLLVGAERPNIRDDLAGGEVDQPLDLDMNAFSVQRGLGEVVHQGRNGCPVAAVEGSKGDGRGHVSKRDHAGHPPRVWPAPRTQ